MTAASATANMKPIKTNLIRPGLLPSREGGATRTSCPTKAIGWGQRTRRYVCVAATLLRIWHSTQSVGGRGYLCEPSGVQASVGILQFSGSTHVLAAVRPRWAVHFHRRIAFCTGWREPLQRSIIEVPKYALAMLAFRVRPRKVTPCASHRSSGRSERLMRVTTESHARFSACGYTKSKQCKEPRAGREKLHRL